MVPQRLNIDSGKRRRTICFKKRPTVVKNICLSTNLLSNPPYCPNTADRRYFVTPWPSDPFPPTTVCTVHKPPIPPTPPLPPKAKRMLIAFIPEIMVCDGDRPVFFKNFRAAGGHGLRAHGLQSWSTEISLPYKQATYNGTPIHIVEGGVDAPVSDLTQENPEYFARLTQLCNELKRADLFLLLSLGDNCSQNTHQQFFTYPFLGGLQTLSNEGYGMVVPQASLRMFTASPGGLYGETKYPLFRSWIKRAIETAKATGVELYIEPQNEFSRMNWIPSDPHPENWYKFVVGEILGNGVPGDHLIHSGNYEIESQQPGLWSQHGVVRPAFAPVPGIDYTKMILSGDGGLNGNSTVDVDVDGYKGLSADDAVSLAVKMDDLGILGYEIMPRFAYRHDQCRANVDSVSMDVPKAMAGAFR